LKVRLKLPVRFSKSTAIKNFLTELHSKSGKLSLDYINDLTDEEAIADLTNYKGIGVKLQAAFYYSRLIEIICPVDTHLHRTLNRIGLVKTKTPDKTFFAINENFPPKLHINFIPI
jgi:endonuclease-3